MIQELFIFNQEGVLQFTASGIDGHEEGIVARNLVVVACEFTHDLDYQYTLVDGAVVATHSPQQAPPDLSE